MRITYDMDRAWLFFRGEPIDKNAAGRPESYVVKSGNAVGGGAIELDTFDWCEVDLPHDYITASGFDASYSRSHGYREQCNGWYRKAFMLEPELSGRQILICFDGTSVNAEFYFNGSLIARSFSAYAETVFDVTERAYFDGRPNVLAVHIIGTAYEGWWYEGAGIYRHVHMYAKDKLHIAHNGIFAKPVLKKGTKNSWTVELETEVENSDFVPQGASVRAEIFDGEQLIAQSVSSTVDVDFTSKATVKQKLNVSKPKRWDIDSPYLYTVKVTVLKDGREVDSDSCRIGFRTIAIDKDTGFWLNGKNIKVKGTCNHQDHAGVGVAIPDSVQYYRIKRLKEMGTNAYRASHNLPTKEVLDICDELGLIVMDENRRFETREDVLGYVEAMVKRDRNHPSVVFWSLFNEEPLQNTDEGARIFKKMRSVVDHLDDSRFVMGAINGTPAGAGLEMDVTGINYSVNLLEKYRSEYPELAFIGSESNSAVTTRGCYVSDREDKHLLNNYDEEVVPWGQTVRETWDFVRKHPWFAGIFIWTGFDYRGEPTPFVWPSVSSQFGIMDTCGFAKDSFYYNKACFTDKPMVHLLPHWNWNKGETVRVVAVNNCDEAELFVNGKSMGRKPSDICAPAEWNVEFVPGRISVKAYKNGKCVAKDERRTAHKAKKIVLEAFGNTVDDSGKDAMIINVSVTDERGIEVPYADNLIKFDISGDAVFLGCGNGDPNSHEADNIPERKAYCGKCQLIVRAKQNAKEISVRAYGEKLEEAVFVPEIVHVEKNDYLESSNIDRNIRKLGYTPTVHKKPDPLMYIAADDNNTLIPTEITTEFPKDYMNGWRIYRAFFTVPPMSKNADEKLPYVLEMGRMCLSGIEVYVDGVKIFEEYVPFGSIVHTSRYPFCAEPGKQAEIRILTYLDEDNKAGVGGMRDYVRVVDNLKK